MRSRTHSSPRLLLLPTRRRTSSPSGSACDNRPSSSVCGAFQGRLKIDGKKSIAVYRAEIVQLRKAARLWRSAFVDRIPVSPQQAIGYCDKLGRESPPVGRPDFKSGRGCLQSCVGSTPTPFRPCRSGQRPVRRSPAWPYAAKRRSERPCHVAAFPCTAVSEDLPSVLITRA